MDAFSEIGLSVIGTIVNALTKLSISQQAVQFGLKEMIKKFEEGSSISTNQLNDFPKNQTLQTRSFCFSQNCRENPKFSR